MAQRWQGAVLAAASGDAGALNEVSTNADISNIITNIQSRYPIRIRPVLHPQLVAQARKIGFRAEQGREAATIFRDRYRIVLEDHVNPRPDLRERATRMVGYMTMIIQNADWLDEMAEKLERGARSSRPMEEVWETFTWASEFFP